MNKRFAERAAAMEEEYLELRGMLADYAKSKEGADAIRKVDRRAPFKLQYYISDISPARVRRIAEALVAQK